MTDNAPEGELAEAEGLDESEIQTDLDGELDDGAVEIEIEAEIVAETTAETTAEIVPVVELSGKEQSARSLKIRRSLEERSERLRLNEDVDYLDYDLNSDLDE